MAVLVSAFGLLMVGIGVLGVVRPRTVIGGVMGWSPQTRMAVAIGVRLVMGVVFLLAAASCRHPTVVTVLGWIALFAAVALPFLGQERLDRLIRWWFGHPPLLMRTWFCFAVAFGGFIVYTGLP